MADEIRYVDDPFEDEEYGRAPRSRPKWQTPDTQFQKEVLNAAHRKYWPDKAIRHQFIMVEKAMQPLTETITPEMPMEWVDNCLKWFRRKNKTGYVPLKGLLTFINNEDERNDFVRKNRGSIIQRIEVDEDDPYG